MHITFECAMCTAEAKMCPSRLKRFSLTLALQTCYLIPLDELWRQPNLYQPTINNSQPIQISRLAVFVLHCCTTRRLHEATCVPMSGATVHCHSAGTHESEIGKSSIGNMISRQNMVGPSCATNTARTKKPQPDTHSSRHSIISVCSLSVAVAGWAVEPDIAVTMRLFLCGGQRQFIVHIAPRRPPCAGIHCVGFVPWRWINNHQQQQYNFVAWAQCKQSHNAHFEMETGITKHLSMLWGRSSYIVHTMHTAFVMQADSNTSKMSALEM